MAHHLILQQQAIDAAKRQDWAAAIEANLSIISTQPQDTGAHNRLGVAYLQLGKSSEAKKQFEAVLETDKSNSIARKHLMRLKNNQKIAPPSFSTIQFIEESGKSKILELHRLAGKQVLETLSVGKPCELKIKSRYISIECDGTYVGALPEDVSFRLSKLITQGNLYEGYVYSFSPSGVSVYLKETFRCKECEDQPSFPLTRNTMAPINDIDEELLLDETGGTGEEEFTEEAEEPTKERGRLPDSDE
jgi:tetratricopeptide (TPR) repeat protein